MADEVARIMEPVARPMPLFPKRPQVVLVVGVNGSGKTTTIGKLASQFRAAGKSVVIAAGDTFRAAAVEQLQIWGERAGVPVMTAPEGSDPASLAFDAMAKAEADGADLLMIDTAGRLQTQSNLMQQLVAANDPFLSGNFFLNRVVGDRGGTPGLIGRGKHQVIEFAINLQQSPQTRLVFRKPAAKFGRLGIFTKLPEHEVLAVDQIDFEFRIGFGNGD